MKVILDLTKLKEDADFNSNKDCIGEYENSNYYCGDCEYKIFCKNIAEA